MFAKNDGESTIQSTVAIDPETLAVVHQLKAALQSHFGPRFAGLYLFGSRARQDHRLNSDLDIAVLLNGASDLSRADNELLDVTYPIQLARSLHIQAWALPANALTSVDPMPRRRLVDTVRREGIAL
jgi:predicted nucleotidyltransferase